MSESGLDPDHQTNVHLTKAISTASVKQGERYPYEQYQGRMHVGNPGSLGPLSLTYPLFSASVCKKRRRWRPCWVDFVQVTVFSPCFHERLVTFFLKFLQGFMNGLCFFS